MTDRILWIVGGIGIVRLSFYIIDSIFLLMLSFAFSRLFLIIIPLLILQFIHFIPIIT